MSVDHAFVKRESEDKLSWSVWRFWKNPSDERVYLDEYVHQTRPTRRHVHRTTARYERLFRRPTGDPGESLKYEQVPLPQDVIDEALAEYVKQITFVGEFKRS